MERIRVKLSSKSFKVKPNLQDTFSITDEFKKSYSSQVLCYENIAKLIKNGHSFIFADYKVGNTDIFEDSIESLSCIALDVDSKINKITMMEMTSLIYNKLGIYPVIAYRTFSDEDFTRFRLIYRLENKIDVATYRQLYQAFCWKFDKYLDKATCNANRIWAGTNKEVFYTENDKPITFNILVKFINSYTSKLRRDKNKLEKERQEKFKSFVNNEVEHIKGDYIKKEHREEVIDYIINSLDIKSFIEQHFGGNFSKRGNKLVGACPIHGGDNKAAFVIFEDTNTYRCFTHCGSGNIITLAKKVYNVEYFSELVFILSEKYGLALKEEWIKRWD